MYRLYCGVGRAAGEKASPAYDVYPLILPDVSKSKKVQRATITA
jgi:hypothetical protein